MELKKIILEKKYLILIIVIFSLGAFLRLYNLSHHSFWADEIFNVNAVALSYGEILFNNLNEATPPLFLLISKIWLTFFNKNEYLIRLLPCLFGIISLIFVYLVSKELFNRRVALMTLFFIAISPFHIFYSQEFRKYSLLLFLSLLSLYVFIKIIKTNLGKGYFILGMINTLIIFTHYFGIFLILIELFYLLIKKKQNIIKNLVISLIPFLLALFFLLRIFDLSQIAKVSRALHISIVEFLLTPAYHTTGYHLITRELPLISMSYFLIMILIFFWLPHLIHLSKIYKKQFTKSTSEKIFLLYALALLPIIIIFIASLMIAPIYLAKFFIFSSCIFYILLSLAIDNIKKSSIKTIFILGVIIISLISLSNYYPPSFKKIGDWKEIGSILDSNNQQIIILRPTSTFTAELPLKYYSKSYKYSLSIDDIATKGYPWVIDWSCEKDYRCNKNPNNKIRLKRKEYYNNLGYQLVFITGYIELYVSNNTNLINIE